MDVFSNYLIPSIREEKKIVWLFYMFSRASAISCLWTSAFFFRWFAFALRRQVQDDVDKLTLSGKKGMTFSSKVNWRSMREGWGECYRVLFEGRLYCYDAFFFKETWNRSRKLELHNKADFDHFLPLKFVEIWNRYQPFSQVTPVSHATFQPIINALRRLGQVEAQSILC